MLHVLHHEYTKYILIVVSLFVSDKLFLAIFHNVDIFIISTQKKQCALKRVDGTYLMCFVYFMPI